MVNLIVWDKLSFDERALAQFVQGMLNRNGVKVYIDIDEYMSYLDEEYAETELFSLIEQNIALFSGAACYDLACDDIGINMAATVSAATDVLCAPRTLIKKLNALGLETVFDLADIKGDRAERQRAVWLKYRDKLNTSALVHQVVKEGNFHLVLRDFSIANRWACIYTSESAPDRQFRREVLEWLDTNVPVYGWNDDEIAFIRDISTYGEYALPSDWSCNHSYFGLSERKLKMNAPRTEIRQGKHYIALVVSDGDNIQWLERQFCTSSTFGQRQRSPMNYKMSWTFSPSLAKLCPAAAERIYAGKKNDYFITGVSGIGYANCLSYPREHLDGFTRLTAEAMADSDLSVVCLLDELHLTEDKTFTEDRLSCYAKYDNIKGGVWELDPDHYRGGRGKIFWANGKPFISVKYSLWHPSDKPGQVTKEFLDDFIKKINALEINPESEDGYTVINIHPWTITIEDLDYVIRGLDDKFEFVYADELIELVKKNLG